MGDKNAEKIEDDAQPEVVRAQAQSQELELAMVAPSVSTNSPEVKSPKKWVVVVGLAVVLVIVVVIGAVMAIVMMGRDSVDEEVAGGESEKEQMIIEDDVDNEPDAKGGENLSGEAETSADIDNDAAVKAVVQKIKNAMVAELQKYIQGFEVQDNENSPYYKAEDMLAFTSLERGYGFEIDLDWEQYTQISSHLGVELRDTLARILKNDGFADYYYREDGDKTMVSYLNARSGVVCQLSVGSSRPIFNCGHVSWLSDEEKALVNELARALETDDWLNEYTIIGVSGGNPDVTNSAYAPYQVLTVGIREHGLGGGAAASFYRISPESEWKLFRVAQDAPACSDYNTDDLKRAYLGAVCWNEATWSEDTVKL